jgi:hypothetical protein
MAQSFSVPPFSLMSFLFVFPVLFVVTFQITQNPQTSHTPAHLSRNHSVGKDVIAQQIFAQGEE